MPKLGCSNQLQNKLCKELTSLKLGLECFRLLLLQTSLDDCRTLLNLSNKYTLTMR